MTSWVVAGEFRVGVGWGFARGVKSEMAGEQRSWGGVRSDMGNSLSSGKEMDG